MRTIDADALKEFAYINKGDFNTVESIRDWIDNAPTVKAFTVEEVEEIRQATMEQVRISCKQNERLQGEWNYIQAGMAICPFCGATPHKQYKNFCPKCGAKMQKDGGES